MHSIHAYWWFQASMQLLNQCNLLPGSCGAQPANQRGSDQHHAIMDIGGTCHSRHILPWWRNITLVFQHGEWSLMHTGTRDIPPNNGVFVMKKQPQPYQLTVSSSGTDLYVEPILLRMFCEDPGHLQWELCCSSLVAVEQEHLCGKVVVCCWRVSVFCCHVNSPDVCCCTAGCSQSGSLESCCCGPLTEFTSVHFLFKLRSDSRQITNPQPVR